MLTYYRTSRNNCSEKPRHIAFYPSGFTALKPSKETHYTHLLIMFFNVMILGAKQDLSREERTSLLRVCGLDVQLNAVAALSAAMDVQVSDCAEDGLQPLCLINSQWE